MGLPECLAGLQTLVWQAQVKTGRLLSIVRAITVCTEGLLPLTS